MALTPSTMIELGTKAPHFKLQDVEGASFSYDDLSSYPVKLVMFICNHCPYVKHVADELAAIGKDYQKKGVGIVAINSNDVENYPDDRPEKMREEKQRRGYVFPYLFDETQDVAKAYRAACTPDFYVFDQNDCLVYRGQLDDSRPGNDKPVTGKDLRQALDQTLAGESVSKDQKPSMGCNIKWRSGQEPDYF